MLIKVWQSKVVNTGQILGIKEMRCRLLHKLCRLTSVSLTTEYLLSQKVLSSCFIKSFGSNFHLPSFACHSTFLLRSSNSKRWLQNDFKKFMELCMYCNNTVFCGIFGNLIVLDCVLIFCALIGCCSLAVDLASHVSTVVFLNLFFDFV